MAKSSSDENETEGMSEDSVASLADVKRGKPRKFVLITKGTSVLSLIVYKKGSLETYKKQAKESGRGTLVYGVVVGRGEDIRFRLAESEGFTREPVKTAALKSYLKDKGDFKCKPTFELVKTLEPTLDPDDPLSARFIAMKATADQACVDFPDRASEIRSAQDEIAKILNDDPSSDDAYAKLNALEKLLTELMLGGKPAAPAHTAGEAPPPPDVELGKFNQRLATILKQATPFAASIGGPLKALAESGRAAAAEKKYDEANQTLAQMVELVNSAKQSLVSPQVTTDITQLTARLKALLSQAKQVDDPSVIAEVKLKASEAQTMLRKQNVPEAQRLIDELASLLAPGGSESDVPVKVFELWRDAREAILERVSRLQDVLRNKSDKRFHVVADKGLNGITKRFQVGLHVALMEFDRAKPDEKETLRTKALQAAAEFDSFLQTDALVKLVDENPFRVPVGLRTDLAKALKQVSAALSG